MAEGGEDARRRAAVAEYRKKLLSCRELEARAKTGRENQKNAKKDLEKTEEDLKALQSVGQIIGEVLRPLDKERFIGKASSGPRYVVACRSKVDKEKLIAGWRRSLLIRSRNLPMLKTMGHQWRIGPHSEGRSSSQKKSGTQRKWTV